MLKKKIFKGLISIITIVLFGISSTNAIIQNYYLFKLGKKKVLLLGAHHADIKAPLALQREDAKEKKIFFNWLTSLEKSNIALQFLIEASDYHVDDRLLSTNDYLALCLEFPVYAKNNNYKVGNVDYIFADYRSLKLQNMLKQIYELIDISARENIFDDKSIRKKYKQIFEYIIGTDTIEDFFKELERVKEQLISENQKLICGDLISFDSEITKLDIDIGKLKQKIKKLNIDPTLSVFNYCIDKIKLSQMALLQTDIINLLWHLADIGFNIKLQISLNKADNVAVYCGFAHILRIIDYLKFMEFKLETQLGEDFSPDVDYATYSRNWNKTNNLSELLESAFGTNSKTIAEQSVVKQLEKLQISSNDSKPNKICAVCVKPNCTNRCGNCKAIYYCSIDCQKADWPRHKANCKK